MSSNFVCKICHKIRKDPIFLPCNCTSICREHALSLAKISCQECHKTFNIPTSQSADDFFKENKQMKHLIESNAYMSGDEKKLKLNVYLTLERIKIIFADLSIKLKEFSLKQYEHFANIKNEIDIQRESILIEVNNDKDVITNGTKTLHASSEHMIKGVEHVEEMFRHAFEPFAATVLSSLSFDIEREETSVEDFFRQPLNINLSSMKRFSGDYEAKLSELQRKVAYFKYLNHELVTRNKFEPSTRMTKHKNGSTLSGGN